MAQAQAYHRRTVRPSGDIALYNQFAQTGGQMAAIGIQIGQMLDQASLSESRGGVISGESQLARQFDEKVAQAGSYGELTQMWAKEMEEYGQKSKDVYTNATKGLSANARRASQNWYAESSPYLKDRFLQKGISSVKRVAPTLAKLEADRLIADGNIDEARQMFLEKSQLISASDQASLLSYVEGAAKESAFEKLNSDMEQLSIVGNTESAINYANEPGRGDEYGLTVDEVQSVISGFRQRSLAKEKQVKAFQAEALRELDKTIDEKIYQSHDLKWGDLSEHPDRVKRWKEWQAELDRIGNGQAVDTARQEQMSLLYRQWRDEPTESNKTAALKYWRDNNTFFEEGERKRWRKQIIEENPASPDALPAMSRGQKAIQDSVEMRIKLYESQLEDDDESDVKKINEIRSWGRRAASSLNRYADELGNKATNKLLDAEVDRLTAMQEAEVVKDFWSNVGIGFKLATGVGIGVGLGGTQRKNIDKQLNFKLPETGTTLGLGFELTEPQSTAEFLRVVEQLKAVNNVEAKKYYDKWAGKYR